MGARYTDYITQEIKQNLIECSVAAKLNHNYYATPQEPLIGDVGKVNYGESNYAVGPMTKTVYLSDTFGNRYKVSVEDLKHVKGHGWITHADADKLDTHYDRDLGFHVEDTAEYKEWLAKSNAEWDKKFNSRKRNV